MSKIQSARVSKPAKVIGQKNYIDQQTGEIIAVQEISKEVDIGFDKIWVGHILEAIEETGNAKITLLFWLIKNKDGNNRIIGTLDEIANQSGVGRATVARTIKALVESNFLIREYGSVLMLNPNVIFQGQHSKRMNVLIRYEEAKQLDLPFDTKLIDKPIKGIELKTKVKESESRIAC
jgi:AraC-like DNA-binding protein